MYVVDVAVSFEVPDAASGGCGVGNFKGHRDSQGVEGDRCDMELKLVLFACGGRHCGTLSRPSIRGLSGGK